MYSSFENQVINNYTPFLRRYSSIIILKMEKNFMHKDVHYGDAISNRKTWK